MLPASLRMGHAGHHALVAVFSQACDPSRCVQCCYSAAPSSHACHGESCCQPGKRRRDESCTHVKSGQTCQTSHVGSKTLPFLQSERSETCTPDGGSSCLPEIGSLRFKDSTVRQRQRHLLAKDRICQGFTSCYLRSGELPAKCVSVHHSGNQTLPKDSLHAKVSTHHPFAYAISLNVQLLIPCLGAMSTSGGSNEHRTMQVILLTIRCPTLRCISTVRSTSLAGCSAARIPFSRRTVPGVATPQHLWLSHMALPPFFPALPLATGRSPYSCQQIWPQCLISYRNKSFALPASPVWIPPVGHDAAPRTPSSWCRSIREWRTKTRQRKAFREFNRDLLIVLDVI